MFRFAIVALCAISTLTGCTTPFEGDNPQVALTDAYNFCATELDAAKSTHGGQAYAQDGIVTKEAWSQCGTPRPTLPPVPQRYDEPYYGHHYYDQNYGRYDYRQRNNTTCRQRSNGSWTC